MLNRIERQEKLKDLGLYKGPINGKWDTATKAAVDKLQKKYFPKKYQDGGKYTEQHTDILLVNAWRVWKYAPHFDLKEFKCACGGKHCTGYPNYLSVNLLKNLEAVRTHFDKPVQITCGVRCQKYNNSLEGSIKNSLHIYGRACDIYVSGTCDTPAGREKVMAYWRSLPRYNYTYAYIPNSKNTRMRTATYMGRAVHVDCN